SLTFHTAPRTPHHHSIPTRRSSDLANHSTAFLRRHPAHESTRFLSADQHPTVAGCRCGYLSVRQFLVRPNRTYPARREPRLHRSSDEGGAQAVAALALG